MNVGELMTQDVKACCPEDTLETAARVMWENDCGCVPVVDANRRVVGMLTDRDICMAAYTKGGPLRALQVSSAMSAEVCTCTAEDTLETAEEMLRTRQVRRLPVVDADGRLAGIISLNDIAREAGRERRQRGKKKAVTSDTVAGTLAAICSPHGQSIIAD